VERWPTEKLIGYAKNPRTHSPAQVAEIAASIREWGWTTPLLAAEDGTLICGHGRALAAQKLGIKSVPVMVARGWSEAQKRAYVIADNKLTLNGGWDQDLLRLEMSELKTADFDLSLTGFGDDELAALFSVPTAGNTDPDDVPEVQPDPVTEPGDVWLLGNHRLVCGDSTDADTVAKALNGVRPHLMVTDPPYGVDYDPAWRSKALNDGAKRAEGMVHNDRQADWREAWSLFPGDVAYVWCAPGPLQCSVHDSLVASGYEPRQQIIWAKNRFVLGRGHYHYQHEPCWYAVRHRSTARWLGDRSQTSLWQIDHRKSETGHGTQKPVECMKRPIENNSSPGQAVYEPFSGSGTTIIAAEMTGRACHAIELSPQYVDVAVRRWQAFTGQVARLGSDGRTFAQVEARKAPVPTQAAE
jgi:DNA modification methylase